MASSVALIAIVVGACTHTSTPSSAPSEDAGADTSVRSSFDPSGYDKSCTTKTDCRLAPFINGSCTTCCSAEAAVNAAAVQADLDAAMAACDGRVRSCLMACEPAHAECVDHVCIACTELPCQGGVLVQTSLSGTGSQVFEATIDGGATIQCSIDHPAGGGTMTSCSPGISLLGGSNTVVLETTTAKTITFRATLDGNLVGEKTFTPTYAGEPGPNGPQCEPKECLVARVTFP